MTREPKGEKRGLRWAHPIGRRGRPAAPPYEEGAHSLSRLFLRVPSSRNLNRGYLTESYSPSAGEHQREKSSPAGRNPPPQGEIDTIAIVIELDIISIIIIIISTIYTAITTAAPRHRFKDLVTENVEDGHIIFCEDASNVVSHPNKPKQVSVPMLSVRIGDHCYYGLCDIGASVSVIPYELYTEIMHEIDSCELEDIDVVIQLANRETISPIGIVRDIEVLCDCKKENILTKFAGESYEFNFSKFTKIPYKADLPSDDFKMEQCASIVLVPNNPLQQHLENSESEIFKKERDELEEIFLRQPILKHDLPVEDLGTTPPPKEDPVFDLKPLPDNLKYAHIDDKKIYPVIISSKLSEIEEEKLLEILKKHRGAIGYTLDDLKGISPSICQHAINMEDDAKPVVEHQRRLISKMKEVVRNEMESCIKDVQGPKGEGSLEDRMEKLEQEVFNYKKMAEREVDIFHKIVSELIDGHKRETAKLWDDIFSLHDTTNKLQAQLYDVHNQNCHEGVQKTLHRLRADFYIPGDGVWCETGCGRVSHASGTRPLRPAGLRNRWTCRPSVADISMDFIEGLPKVGGKSVILTVVDRFSKYAHFIALGHPYTAASVARAFDGIVRLHGFPSSIVVIVILCSRVTSGGTSLGWRA
ncbi:hypothetical protein QYE76_022057 [Lolium multiflorum]|uniref:Integrase catalytic domain-containing protein n=1 Tax=Lolium multiflorum TaxID=4521 RepID=A0AAD8R986_LOLMU|nr:hypothetical protein QYE76_022057 [Lolium multiflorum]